MPKSFTDSERDYIKKRLMDEARTCLAQYGMRKTSVDELVRRANIPKGTFYLFYASKELLFFEVLVALHDELQADLLRRVELLHGDFSPDTVTDLIFGLYKQLDDTAICNFIASGDLELLIRKLPPEIARAHTQKDDFSMEQFLTLIPGTHSEARVKIFSAALRAIFFTVLHKREIGETVYDDAVRVMLRGIVIQLFEEEAE